MELTRPVPGFMMRIEIMSLENNAELNWRHFENGLSQSSVVIAPGAIRGFNPQPEPPAISRGDILSPGDLVGFNPQPEPPAISRGGILSPGDLVGFNPQPEPPAVTVGIEAPGFHVDWLIG